MHLTGARRAPSLPSPRAPIKRLPRAPPSLHRPRPLPSSPRPSAIREAPPSSPSPVSPSPLLSLPLRWSSEKLSEPSISLTRPRTREPTGGDPHRGTPPPPRGPPPPHPPGAHCGSPEKSQPLPVLNHPPLDQEPGHRRQTAVKLTSDRPFSLARPVRSRRLAVTPFPPPSALADKWAHSDAVVLAHPRRLPSLVGRSWAVSAPARARARVGQKPSP
jgi:hypothetical protein